MISIFSQNGYGMKAIPLFEQMLHEGTKPSYVSLVCVLSAWNHTWLVEEGKLYFDHISRDYWITPRVEHYSCMIDLLGRAGKLIDGEDFIDSMSFKPGIMAWQTLLGACKSYGNIDSTIHTAEHLLSLDPEDVATYVLLSNLAMIMKESYQVTQHVNDLTIWRHVPSYTFQLLVIFNWG